MAVVRAYERYLLGLEGGGTMMRPLLALTVSLGLLLMPVGAPSAESGGRHGPRLARRRNSEGNAINNQGQVVGSAQPPPGSCVSLEEGRDDRSRTLGRRSVPTAINEHGRVVGRSDTTTARSAPSSGKTVSSPILAPSVA